MNNGYTHVLTLKILCQIKEKKRREYIYYMVLFYDVLEQAKLYTQVSSQGGKDGDKLGRAQENLLG